MLSCSNSHNDWIIVKYQFSCKQKIFLIFFFIRLESGLIIRSVIIYLFINKESTGRLEKNHEAR